MVASDIAPQIAESSGSASTDSGYKSTAPDSVGAGTAEQERCLRARFGPRDAAFFKVKRQLFWAVAVLFLIGWSETPHIGSRGQRCIEPTCAMKTLGARGSPNTQYPQNSSR